MTRIFDIIFSFFGLVILSPLFILLTFLGFVDTGYPFFFQERLGKDKRKFKLIKFRSMRVNAPSVATHLANSSFITPYGSLLRKSKLDEIPQLWNVLEGSMSFVGPRPNLINQTELIRMRDSLGVYSARPGITGLAQISKIDMSSPMLLSETDAKMIKEHNILKYFKYILLTISGKGLGDGIVK